MQNCSLQRGIQILSDTVSDKMYIFDIFLKNTIKIPKFHFLNQICEIRKTPWDGQLFAYMRFTNSQQDIIWQDVYFMFWV